MSTQLSIPVQLGNQHEANSKAAPRPSKKIIYFLRGDTITDDLLKKMADELLADAHPRKQKATAKGKLASND